MIASTDPAFLTVMGVLVGLMVVCLAVIFCDPLVWWWQERRRRRHARSRKGLVT